MALKRYEKYPNRWSPATPEQPQGAFKNRTTSVSKDGSYIEKDWANDWSGFFGAALGKAGIVPNGEVDTALSSQYYEAFRTFFYNPENKPDPVDIGAADRSHGHQIANVNGLQEALDSKSANGHKHNISDVISLQANLDSKFDKSGGSAGYFRPADTVGSSYGLAGGNGDGATLDKNNIRIESWWGIGFWCTQGTPRYSHSFDARNGDTRSLGEYYAQADKRVYHQGFKPSAADVGALGVNDKAFGLRGHYYGGGSEKPDHFGAGILKNQMLAGSNIGSSSLWNDCLWISSYGSGDVPQSTLLAFGKTDQNFIGFSTQNFDSSSWGVMKRIYHTGYKPSAADVGAYSKSESDAKFISGVRLGTATDYGVYSQQPSGARDKAGYVVTAAFIDIAAGAIDHVWQRPLQYLLNGTWYTCSSI